MGDSIYRGRNRLGRSSSRSEITHFDRKIKLAQQDVAPLTQQIKDSQDVDTDKLVSREQEMGYWGSTQQMKHMFGVGNGTCVRQRTDVPCL